jgi:uncharacterized protein
LRHDGVLRQLSAREFEHLCEAMCLHSDGHTMGEPAILACWDADRLDLGRVGIEPDPARLCTVSARQARTIEAAVRMAVGTLRTPRYTRRVKAPCPGDRLDACT